MSRFGPSVRFGAALLTLAVSVSAQEPVTAFVDVTVVPLDRIGTLERQTVLVRGEKIVSVQPTSRAQIPVNATRIDGRDKFLMPGLAEMHAHVVGPQNPHHEAVNRDIMFLYVANGITSIRAMLGAPNQLPLRKALRRGEVLGPTMYVSAPSLNGNSAPNTDSGAKLVRMHKAAGYDFLKIHPGLSRETYDAIVRTAVAGNRADLVLLDANPLQDVANLKKRSGVMVKGRWMSAAEIDRGLAELASRYAQ